MSAFTTFNGFLTSSFSANAVAFNGSNTYLEKTTNYSNVSDGKEITISLWFKPDTLANNTYFLFGGDFGVRNNIAMQISALGSISMLLNESTTGTSNIALSMSSGSNYSSSQWYHLLFSCDLTNSSNRHFYVSDVDDSPTYSQYNNLTIPYTNIPDNRVGGDAQASPLVLFDGDMSEVWVDYSYIDLSVEANRRKFIDGSGKPVSLGSDGSQPTGSQPTIFLSGDTAAWHTNKGDGGGFTENGALTTATTSPSD